MREYKTQRTALIDADFIAYQLAAWAHSNQASTEEMHERITETYADWKLAACADRTIVCFSCSREENYRKDYYPLYKSNRTSTPPAMLPMAQKLVGKAGDRIVRVPRLEADDIMGMIQSAGKLGETVIVTEDKDLRQVAGWHLNPKHDDFPKWVSEDDGDRLFFQQWLTGDSVDGFGGIKGVGAKNKLVKALDGMTIEEREAHVMAAYADKGYSVEDALAQARCARILRAVDFDSDNNTHIAWGKHLEV